MKAIVAIQADLDTTSLGTRSRLAEEIDGGSILRRTVERISRAKRFDAVYVLCPETQRERCAGLLEGSGAEVRPYAGGPAPWSALVRAARGWSLDGWRGGIGGTTCFDEYTDCRLLDGLLATVKAELVLSIPSAAPLIDPDLADRMVEQKEDCRDELRLVFTQALPGVTGLLLERELIHEFAEKSHPIGWIFSFKPDDPQRDLIFQPCCVDIPAALRYAAARLAADTDRSTQTVRSILNELDDPDPASIGRWLLEHERASIEPLPREVEIELTIDDPYPDALLRPRGSRIESRGPIDVETVKRIATEMARFDDSLIVLGGFGDPLRHPQLRSIIRAVRTARCDGRGVFGLALRTTGVDLTEEHIDTLIAEGVDVVQVTLDARTPELYGRLQSPNNPSGADLGAVVAGVDRLNETRQERHSITPITVPDMTKSRDNVHELDDFHDEWLRKVGAVSITGYCHFARQCEDRSVMNMAPSARVGCRRVRSRCCVLADGRVTVCDQDFNGRFALGRVGERTLEAIWTSAEFERVRAAHRDGTFDPTPLCAACDEWHRP